MSLPTPYRIKTRVEKATDLIADRKALYDELLQLLCKSELAARNGEWMTCGTWAKNVMNRAYEIGNAEVRAHLREAGKLRQPQELDLPNIPDNTQ